MFVCSTVASKLLNQFYEKLYLKNKRMGLVPLNVKGSPPITFKGMRNRCRFIDLPVINFMRIDQALSEEFKYKH